MLRSAALANVHVWISLVVLGEVAAPSDEETTSFGPVAESTGLWWADFDGDGFEDAYAIGATGAGRLLRNRGDGSFEDVTLVSGLDQLLLPSFALWYDFDGDDRQDLYVGTHAGSSHLMRNAGDGTFQDVTASSGLRVEGRPLSARVLDYDRDGLADVLIRTAAGDRLYHALGSGTFEPTDFVPRDVAWSPSPASPEHPQSTPTGPNVDPPICAFTLLDHTSGMCVEADSTATLGKLYPLGPEFNIDSGTGNVGIGSLTPGAKLDVAGTVRMTGFELPTGAANGSILAGDANGVGTWQRGHGLGNGNVATGPNALSNLTTGSLNTANGSDALRANTSGLINSASGFKALYSNTTGLGNTAAGYGALVFNTTGNFNTAHGARALRANTTGRENTASGYRALRSNTTGSGNIGIGFRAGENLTSGGNNIAIGHYGVAGESNTIRFGDSQTRTFIAGIRGATTAVADAIPVVIDSNGQLGTISSSRRFKEQIRDMGDATERLIELRPVLFRYKQEVAGTDRPVQYGLIAEEVAEVLPELVVYDEQGRPLTVKYHLLSSMLLNELQKQVDRDAARALELRALEARLQALEAKVDPLDSR